MIGHNSAVGRNPFTFAEFDALPWPVRDTLNYALVDLGSRRARMNLIQGRSVAVVCAIERGVAAGVTRRHILAAYGPDHPYLSKAARA